MDMEENLKWQKEVTGIQRYHDLGYKGKGVTVLCHENTEHGKKAMQVLKQIAPEVTIIFGTVSQSTSGNTLKRYNWIIDGVTYSFDEVMKKFKPDIISCSLKSDKENKEREAIIQPYIDNGELIMVTCSGNDGSEGAKAMYHNGLVIGACQFYNKKTDIRYVSYSGRTKEELDVDYVGFIWDWSGTSAATPFVAGQIALFMSRFGKISQKDFQKVIKEHCKDLGDPEKDWIYGDGLIILPESINKDLIEQIGEEKEMFKDIEENRWSKKDIEDAVSIGLVTGFEDGTFRPEEHVTREQMCAVLMRAIRYIEKNTDSQKI